jgi:hypothetical protein
VITATLSFTSVKTVVCPMLTLETPEAHSSALDSPLTALSDHVSLTKDVPKTVAYIEPPPLATIERAKYEAVSNRDLPQDFDYSVPLSDPVIIGEYHDNTGLWYYIENAAGIAHRVSMPPIVSFMFGNDSPLSF